LLWLRQNGLEAALKKQAAQGVPIFGVCGGYQMLGKVIADPLGIEAGGTVEGLALLPVETVFDRQKRTVQSKGRFAKVQGIFSELTGKACTGYEIHAGVTKNLADCFLTELGQDEQILEGAQKVDKVYNVYGSYCHGMFESSEIVQIIVAALMKHKGLTPEQVRLSNWQEYKEQQYDKLAAALRLSIDMKQVYKIIREGI